MLESCSSLVDCEELLRNRLEDLSLLSEITLTQKDYEHLSGLIREKIRGFTRSMRLLWRQTPTTMAYFIVNAGTYGYQDGDYWSAVWDALEIKSAPSKERVLGTYFLQFLREHQLPIFQDLPHSHRYVTPILLHGGIPTSCLIEYFERVVLPGLGHDPVASISLQELLEEVRLLRKDVRKRGTLEARITDMEAFIDELRQRTDALRESKEVRSEILKLWEMEKEISELDEIDDLSQAYSQYQTEHNELEHEIQALVRHRHDSKALIAAYGEQDRTAMENIPAFQTWMEGYGDLQAGIEALPELATSCAQLNTKLDARAAKIFSEGWEDGVGDQILQLDLDQLEKDIAAWQDTAGEVTRLREQLSDLQSETQPRRVMRLLPPASVIGGVLIIMLVLLTSLPSILAVVGLVVVGAAGYTIFRQRKTASERNVDRQQLTDALQHAQKRRRAISERVAETLYDLPVNQDLIANPSSNLVNVLADLAKLHQRLSEMQIRRDRLQKRVDQRIEELEDIATRLSTEPSEDVAKMVDEVAGVIKQAHARCGQAVEARAKLEQVINPQLHHLQQKLTSIEEGIAVVERRLRGLGEGDIQAGLRYIAELSRMKQEALEQRHQLQAKYANLQQIEETLQSSDRSLDNKLQSLEDHLQSSKRKKSKLVMQLDRIPTPYQGIDEPIRKYLLYGGEVAERFLKKSSVLMQCALKEDVVARSEAESLPSRVLQAFDRWWTVYSERQQITRELESKSRVAKQRLRAPSIVLDQNLVEVTVLIPSQRCQVSAGGNQLRLEVKGDTLERSQNISLITYQEDEDLLSTEKESHLLTFPANKYTFALHGKTQALREWEIPARREEAECFLFHARSGRLLAEGRVPRSRIWIISQDVSPADEKIVRETGHLYGQWHAYTYWIVDLTEVDVFQVVDQRGNEVTLPLAPPTSVELGLIEGQKVRYVTSEGAPVYTGTPPRLQLPVKNEATLQRWRLSIYTERNDRQELIAYHQLSDLSQALESRIDEGWVAVDLNHADLLGQHPLGLYHIHARNAPYVNWREDICSVPSLEAAFEKDLYPPYEVDDPLSVHAPVTLGKTASLSPQSPTQSSQLKPGKFRLKATTVEASLRCRLNFSGRSHSGPHELSLNLRIPKIRWRFQGIDIHQADFWQDAIAELWLGDLEQSNEAFLILDLGDIAETAVHLNLPNRPSTSKRKRSREGKARFDFLPFIDELRTMTGLQVVNVSIPDLNVMDAPIFRVRTCWEASDIECVQRTEENEIILDVSWTELGKTGGKSKILRLWNDAPGTKAPVAEAQVSGTSHKLKVSKSELAAGQYFLQLTLEDPWSSTLPSRPNLGDLNTKLIVIAVEKDPLQDRTLRVRYIGDRYSHRKRPLKGIYTFRIIGKVIHQKLPETVSDDAVLVTTTNEGWYVAEVNVLNDPQHRIDVQGANPVKIEYAEQWHEINCVEDRAGDGAMYCCECQRLHWRQATIDAEVRQDHKIMGPIEKFYVDSDTDV
jgi:predicted  nucleic acid-binding Zn-ribbon protein